MMENVSQSKVWRIGLGVCGGIAAYKAVEVLRGLQKAGCHVLVAMTKHATEFVQPLTFRALTGEYVWVDDYEKENPDPIAHINFSQNIDLFLIAPATANIIAKFANGIADDFISTAYLASHAPVLIAPAMNTTMLLHPATQRNLEKLRADNVLFVEPEAGEMACKTIGPGRLSEPETIVKRAVEILGDAEMRGRGDAALKTKDQKPKTKDLAGEHLLITAGATREEIDPVRFISNYSSGKMGFAIAEAARDRGAEVTLIAGVTSINPPPEIKTLRVTTAAEMHRVVLQEMPKASIFVAAAAVADYRPKVRANEKIKKSGEQLIIELEKTPDILADVARKRLPNQIIVGFAAETEKILEHASNKLIGKNLDMIVVNDVSRNDSGFGSDTNLVTILRLYGEPLALPLLPKSAVANRILDEIANLRKGRDA